MHATCRLEKIMLQQFDLLIVSKRKKINAASTFTTTFRQETLLAMFSSGPTETQLILTVPVVVLVHSTAVRGIELTRAHQVGSHQTYVLDDLQRVAYNNSSVTRN